MLRLVVSVPEARDRTAVVTLADGWRVIRRDLAAAAVSTALAARRGNPAAEPLRPFGHPPFGKYSLLGVTETPADGVSEYGRHLLAFEPQAGPALEAEAFGRLVLLAFAGPRGRDARLRRTQGGLRLTSSMVEALVARIGPDTELELVLRPQTARPWWMVWRRRPGTVLPFSSEEPLLVAAPLDEASLTTYVLERMPPRRRRRAADVDEKRDRSNGDASSRTPSSGRDAPLEPGGGTFGGGGASGGWEAGPSGTARPPGVDAAGRIVGTAAAAAGLGGAIAAQGDASAEAPAETSAAGVGADEGSGGSESPGNGDDRGAVDSADAGSGTQMSTAY